MIAVAEVPDWFGTESSSDWSYGQPPYEWDAFDSCLSVLDRSSSLQDADVSDSSSRIVPTKLQIATTIEDDEASASTRTGFATPTSSVLNDDCHSRPQLLAASDLLEPEDSGSIVRCSCRASPKLHLDYSGVLSAWNAQGGGSAVNAGTAAHDSLMLCLPPPASGLSLPTYDLQAAPPQLSLSTSHIRPLSYDLRREAPLRVASLQSNSSCGMFRGISFTAEDDGPEDMCEAGLMPAAGLMPPIASSSPRPYSTHTLYGTCNEAIVELPPLPQTLACIPARSTGNSSAARAAAVTRYKDKKHNRQTGKIRYEMRKINAEKRPRIKGRFVKRADLAAALERQLESLSPLSQDSALSEAIWA